MNFSSTHNSNLLVPPLNTPSIRAIAPPQLQRPHISTVPHQNFAQLEEHFANYFFQIVNPNLFSSKRPT